MKVVSHHHPAGVAKRQSELYEKIVQLIAAFDSRRPRKERAKMKVGAKDSDQTFLIEAGEDAAPLLRALQKVAPDIKLVAITEDERKAFVVTLGELDLDHWSLSTLNPRVRFQSERPGSVAQSLRSEG